MCHEWNFILFIFTITHVVNFLSCPSNMPRKHSRTDGGMICLLKLVGLNPLSYNKSSVLPTFLVNFA
jgi:hypothetical protein